jgi:hypothetical protein
VQYDFEALVLESGGESIDSIGVASAYTSVEEAGVNESFGYALFASEELLALGVPHVSKPLLIGIATCHAVRPRGRVEWFQGDRPGS